MARKDAHIDSVEAANHESHSTIQQLRTAGLSRQREIRSLGQKARRPLSTAIAWGQPWECYQDHSTTMLRCVCQQLGA